MNIPGPRSQEYRQREEIHLAPGLQRFAQLAGITLKRGQGTRLYDVDGRRYIDFIGGIGVGGIGHSHPKWVAAVEDQLRRLVIGSFTSPARVELLERISEFRPSPRLNRVQLYTSGAEAVESALRLAKCHTGKHEIVSFWGGFHGKTLGTLSAMGSDARQGWGPLAPGYHIAHYAHCHHCPLSLKYSACGLACANAVREQIRRATSGSVAAILIEPMQGSGGNVIPPSDFLRAIRSIADELGALLIADEMITGFGRTGKDWGVHHSGVEPDIVTIGKQFGGGMPISGLITRDEIAQSRPWSEPSGSSSSYGGNALACAAAAATLRIIREEKLVENSRRMGELLLARLRRLSERHPVIGEVRGQGLFLGVELVDARNRKTKLSRETCERLFSECLRRGLLTMSYDPVFRLQPAMVIDEPTLDEAVLILDEALTEVCGE